MHRVLMSLAVLAALGTSSVAMAAMPMMGMPKAPPAKMAAAQPVPTAMTTTGSVLAVNTEYCTVTLANMGVFVFAQRCDLSKIAAGQWVTITWSKSGNLRAASKIEAAKPMGMAGMMMMPKMGMMKH